MSSVAIEHLICCQADLIRALDERDIEAILAAAHALSDAVENARWGSERHGDAEQLEYAHKQSTALKIRINTLSEWNRQRIDRLGELRGIPKSDTYAKYDIIH
jgi:hypothetical protein